MTDGRPPRRVTVVAHASGLGAWEAVDAVPHPALGGHLVGDYRGWRERAGTRTVRREVPWVGVPVIVNFGTPFGVDSSGRGAGMATFRSFAAGLHDRFALTEAAGDSHCLQFDLTLAGAVALFGPALADMTNLVVDLDDLLGADAGRLVDRLATAPDWPARFDRLDDFLLARLRAAPALPADLAWAARRLEQHDGRVRIDALAGRLDCSRARFAGRFRDALGLSPKAVARVHRFQAARRRLEAGDAGLAAVALDAGYYDQAHFNREFRALAGCTPLAYRRELRPDQGGAVVDRLEG